MNSVKFSRGQENKKPRRVFIKKYQIDECWVVRLWVADSRADWALDVSICLLLLTVITDWLMFLFCRCIDQWFKINRSCPEHPSDWLTYQQQQQVAGTTVVSQWLCIAPLNVFYSDSYAAADQIQLVLAFEAGDGLCTCAFGTVSSCLQQFIYRLRTLLMFPPSSAGIIANHTESSSCIVWNGVLVGADVE